MLEQSLRHHYQSMLVDPLAKVIGNKLNPIAITAAASLLGLTFIPLLLTGQNLTAIVCLLLSGYLDTLDGSVARLQNKSSPIGAVMDIMSDRLVECCVILGFYLVAAEARGLACLLMLASTLLCVTSFLVVGIFNQNTSQKSFHYSSGLMERAEAFIFFCLMILLPDFFIPLAYSYISLVLLTAIIRLNEFRQQQSTD